MAEGKKKTAESKVTRISAADSGPKPKSKAKAAKPAVSKAKSEPKAKTTTKPVEAAKNPFQMLAGYFKGAWYELTQVRWPNRRTTWSLTLAVILFSLFFVVMIVLLDTLFGKLFNLLVS